MARGWESKAVEDQIEEKKARRPDSSSAKSAEELEQERRLSSLNLSRSRLLQQLETARNPAHRQMLLNGLSAVEREIEEVSASPR
jgi:hypothetical protein